MAEYCHSCSKCPPFARTHARRRPRRSSIALSMMVFMIHGVINVCMYVWSGQCNAKHAENATSVNNTCLDKIICYIQRIFNKNRRPLVAFK